MAEPVITSLAYCKLLLHAAKYPHRSINGVLLAEKPKSKDVKTVKFVDAVPLFHQSIHLSPMMEVALIQLDAHYRSQGLVIAGYYQANSRLHDSQPNAVACRIVERIQDHYEHACMFMLDNTEISLDCDEDTLKLYVQSEGKWKPQKCNGCLEKATLGLASSLLHSRAWRDLVDFDNHLDDITLDWKNLQINELLQHAS